MTQFDFIHSGLRTIDIEAEAVAALRERVGVAFTHACQLMLNCNSRIIVTGMGKSGHIGKKIAATLTSTGTPAFFMQNRMSTLLNSSHVAISYEVLCLK